MKYLIKFWPWSRFADLEKQLEEAKSSAKFAQQAHQFANDQLIKLQDQHESVVAEHAASRDGLRKMADILARRGLDKVVGLLLFLLCWSLEAQPVQRQLFTTNPPPIISTNSGLMVSTNGSGVPVLTYNGGSLTNVHDGIWTNDPTSTRLVNTNTSLDFSAYNASGPSITGNYVADPNGDTLIKLSAVNTNKESNFDVFQITQTGTTNDSIVVFDMDMTQSGLPSDFETVGYFHGFGQNLGTNATGPFVAGMVSSVDGLSILEAGSVSVANGFVGTNIGVVARAATTGAPTGTTTALDAEVGNDYSWSIVNYPPLFSLQENTVVLFGNRSGSLMPMLIARTNSVGGASWHRVASIDQNGTYTNLWFSTPTNSASVGQVVTATSTAGDSKWSTPTSGTVTSVGLSLPNIFTVSGSPVTASGTLTGTLANENANTIFAGPSSGGAATPAFRIMVGSDIPSGIVANSSLANSSITIAGTANQVSVAGGGPVALGGTATLSLPNGVAFPGGTTNTTAEIKTNTVTASFDLWNGTVNLFGVSNAPATATTFLQFTNTVPATANNQQYSPFLSFIGNGWKTAATAASQPVEFKMGVVTVQGSTGPSGSIFFSNSINGGTPIGVFNLNSAGGLTIPGNFSTGGTLQFSQFIFSPGNFNLSGTGAGQALWQNTADTGFTSMEFGPTSAWPTLFTSTNSSGPVFLSNASIGATNGFASYFSNQLAITTITVGSSPFNWTNTFSKNVTVFVDGAGVSAAAAINGTTVYTAVTGGDYNLPLQPGEWATITYTVGAPGMKWKPF